MQPALTHLKTVAALAELTSSLEWMAVSHTAEQKTLTQDTLESEVPATAYLSLAIMSPISQLTLPVQESESSPDCAGGTESSPSLTTESSLMNSQDCAMQPNSQSTLPGQESESPQDCAGNDNEPTLLNPEDCAGNDEQSTAQNMDEGSDSINQPTLLNPEDCTGNDEQSASLKMDEDSGSINEPTLLDPEDYAGNDEQSASLKMDEDSDSINQPTLLNPEDCAGNDNEQSTAQNMDGGSDSINESATSVVDTSPAIHEITHPTVSKFSNPSALLTLFGLGIGAAANTAAIGFAAYNLLLAPPLDPGLDLFVQATEQYQAGDIKQAVALAKSVASYSSAYHEAHAAIDEWEQNWQIATRQVQLVEQAFKQSRWRDVLEESNKIPEISAWHKKIEPMVQKAASKLDSEVQKLLETASERAKAKDFTGALKALKQIPKGLPDYSKVEAKIFEYTEKQRIKSEAVAHQLLQQAYNRAGAKDFAGALTYLKKVPKETTAFPTAQAKWTEYSKKLRLQAKTKSPTPATTVINRRVEPARQPGQRAAVPVQQLISNNVVPAVSESIGTVRNVQSLNPGDCLQEIEPMSVILRA